MSFLYEYLMFLGQVVTLVIGFLVVVSFLASLSNRASSGEQGHLQVRKLNDRLRDLRFSMESHLLTPDQAKKQHKAELKREKAEAKKAAKKAAKSPKSGGTQIALAQSAAEKGPEESSGQAHGAEDSPNEQGADSQPTETGEPPSEKPRTFVIRFDGDVAATAVEHFRIEVSAVLTMAQPQDEVVVCI